MAAFRQPGSGSSDGGGGGIELDATLSRAAAARGRGVTRKEQTAPHVGHLNFCCAPSSETRTQCRARQAAMRDKLSAERVMELRRFGIVDALQWVLDAFLPARQAPPDVTTAAAVVPIAELGHTEGLEAKQR